MQDEIVKHSRKILGIFKNTNQPFLKKMKEIAVEIFIIVFAVTFSIWLHSLKEHSHEQKEVRVFLQNLRDDLMQDIKWLKSDVKAYNDEIKGLENLIKMSASNSKGANSPDIEINFSMHLFMNKINNGNYEGFKSSGKIGYIENEKLKKAILNYYQQNALNIEEMSNMFNQSQVKALESFDDINDKTFSSPKVQLKLEFLKQIAETSGRFCDKVLIKDANNLIVLIDKELAK